MKTVIVNISVYQGAPCGQCITSPLNVNALMFNTHCRLPNSLLTFDHIIMFPVFTLPGPAEATGAGASTRHQEHLNNPVHRPRITRRVVLLEATNVCVWVCGMMKMDFSEFQIYRDID